MKSSEATRKIAELSRSSFGIERISPQETGFTPPSLVRPDIQTAIARLNMAVSSADAESFADHIVMAIRYLEALGFSFNETKIDPTDFDVLDMAFGQAEAVLEALLPELEEWPCVNFGAIYGKIQMLNESSTKSAARKQLGQHETIQTELAELRTVVDFISCHIAAKRNIDEELARVRMIATRQSPVPFPALADVDQILNSCAYLLELAPQGRTLVQDVHAVLSLLTAAATAPATFGKPETATIFAKALRGLAPKLQEATTRMGAGNFADGFEASIELATAMTRPILDPVERAAIVAIVDVFAADLQNCLIVTAIKKHRKTSTDVGSAPHTGLFSIQGVAR